MISKQELERQYQEKQEQINTQRQSIVELQKNQLEKATKIEECNQKNAGIIAREIPSILRQIQLEASSSEQLDCKNKEFVLAHVEQQLLMITAEDKRYREIANPERIEKILALLSKVQDHLNKGVQHYDSKELAKLADESGVPSRTLPAKKGFKLLLEILGEDPKKYSYTWKSTDYQNLSTVVPLVIERTTFIKDEDNRYFTQLTQASKSIEQLKSKLISTYEERDRLAGEVTDLGEEIIRIETGSLQELIHQAETLEQELRKLAEQERQTELRRIQELREKSENTSHHRESEVESSAKNELGKEEPKQEIQANEERVALARTLKTMLVTYQNERNAHYKAKDFFNHKDKDLREEFIRTIGDENNGLLKDYVISGNCEEVLKKITSGIAYFKGIKMQATLNRMVVKLLDAHQKSEVIEDLAVKAQATLSIFTQRKGRPQQYAQKIQDLYEKIAGIKAYAATLPENKQGTINELGDLLQKDLDRFVIQSPNELPAKDAYQQFDLRITARLHSQDDIMSDEQSWSAIVFNFLLCVATLAKLIYSKAKTGRASLFFDKTEVQKEIEAPVDAALEDLRNFFTLES